MFQLLQGRQAWPFHMMATATATGCLLDAGANYSCGGGAGDCFVLGWEPPPLGLFGALAAADVHELFPLCACQPSRLFGRFVSSG